MLINIKVTLYTYFMMRTKSSILIQETLDLPTFLTSCLNSAPKLTLLTNFINDAYWCGIRPQNRKCNFQTYPIVEIWFVFTSQTSLRYFCAVNTCWHYSLTDHIFNDKCFRETPRKLSMVSFMHKLAVSSVQTLT